jgi:hypothetical protein
MCGGALRLNIGVSSECLVDVPRSFTRSVAVTAVSYFHMGMPPCAVSRLLLDAWECSVRAMDERVLHPCLFYLGVLRILSDEFAVPGSDVSLNCEQLLLWPLWNAPDRRAFTWDRISPFLEAARPGLCEDVCLSQAWTSLSRIAFPELDWRCVFPKFLLLFHEYLDDGPMQFDSRRQ